MQYVHIHFIVAAGISGSTDASLGAAFVDVIGEFLVVVVVMADVVEVIVDAPTLMSIVFLVSLRCGADGSTVGALL